MPFNDIDVGKKSGYETISFTSDGGFIVGGYCNYKSDEFPVFKSSGQVDSGKPILQKFPATVANAGAMSSAPTPEWTYICNDAVF